MAGKKTAKSSGSPVVDDQLKESPSLDQSGDEHISPAFSFYESCLAEASENCKENKIFDSWQLLERASRKESCMLGIDEAGRGPVLGPMVYACAVAPISRLTDLRSIGFADSKTLSEQQREDLLRAMINNTDWLAYSAHVISPVYISEKMLDKCKTSLNAISHDAAIGLIQSALDAGINLTEVYVDTVGKAEHYQAKLQSLFPSVRICVESKADDTYPIVSAASIVAKVTRDRLLQLWPKDERGPMAASSIPIGSGYPGDPVTKNYLQLCMDPILGFPSLVRSSWSTAGNLLDKSGVQIEWEDDEDAEQAAEAKRLARKRELAKGTCKLSAFFSPDTKSTAAVQKAAFIRQPFFSRSGLSHVDRLI